MAILSFSRRFIFIKTTKTAGTSLEVHLEAICGPEDIITPIYPSNKSHQPRNHGEIYYNHMPASLMRSLQPAAFEAFFKFCFERHPVDKCLSHYAMLANSPEHKHPTNPKSWEAYLEQGNFPIDCKKYCSEDGVMLVDKIYRFESLAVAVRDIESRLGFTIGPIAAREKSGFRNGPSKIPALAEIMNNIKQKSQIMDAFADSLCITPYE